MITSLEVKMRINKCCFEDKNVLVIKEMWSYLCGVCGRYTYDYDSNQCSVKQSKLLLGKERYSQLRKLAKEKIASNQALQLSGGSLPKAGQAKPKASTK